MSGATGKLSLVFRKKDDGVTYMAKQYYKLPLQVLRPHYQDDDGTAFVYMLNPSGGVLQNDKLYTDIVVEPNARALVTTPSSTKFYKSDEGHSEISNRAELHSGSVLEYIPEHNVPYGGSRTYQENEFHLCKDSTLIAFDMSTAGRVSMGEVFRYDIYSSLTKIYVDGKLKLYDRACIEPHKLDLSKPGLMEGFLSNGTIYAHAPSIPDGLIDDLNSMGHSGEINFAAGIMDDNIIVTRFLGSDIIVLKDTVNAVWDRLRRALLDKPAVKIRKF